MTALDRPSPWAFERGALWAADVQGPRPAHVAPRRPAEFGEVSRAHADLVAHRVRLAPERVQQRFAEGARCFAAHVEGQIAACGWVSQGSAWVGELERRLRLARGEVYIWDCVTLPAYRGQRLYPALLSCLLVTLRTEGVRRAWIGASLDNAASTQGIATAGFRPVVWARYGRLGRLYALWIGGYRQVPPQDIAAARAVMDSAHEARLGPVVLGLAPSK